MCYVRPFSYLVGRIRNLQHNQESMFFLGGINGRSDYLWQINFSSMEKSKKIFIFVSDMKC